MPQWIIDILISLGTGGALAIGGALMAKLFVAQKLIDILDGLCITGQKLTDVFVGKHAGVKNEEEADEFLWGTIGIVLREVGKRIVDRVKSQDSDGDFKTDAPQQAETDEQRKARLAATDPMLKDMGNALKNM
jgi:hypothetical protein